MSIHSRDNINYPEVSSSCIICPPQTAPINSKKAWNDGSETWRSATERSKKTQAQGKGKNLIIALVLALVPACVASENLALNINFLVLFWEVLIKVRFQRRHKCKDGHPQVSKYDYTNKYCINVLNAILALAWRNHTKNSSDATWKLRS